MKSLFVKKSFAFLVFFASQFFCFAAGKNVKQLVPMEVTPVEYRNIYLNWNNEGTPQFFSYEDLQNDVNALNYLISTAYAGYEDAVKRGLNLETFAEQVDDYYYSYDRISTDDYIHTLTNFLEKKSGIVILSFLVMMKDGGLAAKILCIFLMSIVCQKNLIMMLRNRLFLL